MEQVFQTAREKMNKTVNAMMGEFATIRVGRATPSVLDKVTVDYYGAPTPDPVDHSLGQKHLEGHRKSHPSLRYRPESPERRQCPAAEFSSID